MGLCFKGFVLVLLIISTRAFVLKQRDNNKLGQQKHEIEKTLDRIFDQDLYRNVWNGRKDDGTCVVAFYFNELKVFKVKD